MHENRDPKIAKDEIGRARQMTRMRAIADIHLAKDAPDRSLRRGTSLPDTAHQATSLIGTQLIRHPFNSTSAGQDLAGVSGALRLRETQRGEYDCRRIPAASALARGVPRSIPRLAPPPPPPQILREPHRAFRAFDTAVGPALALLGVVRELDDQGAGTGLRDERGHVSSPPMIQAVSKWCHQPAEEILGFFASRNRKLTLGDSAVDAAALVSGNQAAAVPAKLREVIS